MDSSPFIIIVLIVIAMTFKSIIQPLFKLATQQKPKSTPPRVAPRTRGLSEPEVYPYVSCGSILTPAELAFFKALRPVINEQWHIFTKVRLEDIINVKPGLERKVAYGFRGRIKSRHIDFVLCDKDTLEILMCIELDDSSHQRKDRIERDKFVDKAIRDADLTIIHIPVRRIYSEAYLKSQLFEPEDASEAATPTNNDRGVTAQSESASPQLEAVGAITTSADPHARWKPSANV